MSSTLRWSSAKSIRTLSTCPTWLTGVYDYSLDQLLQRLRAGSMHAILQLLTGMRIFAVHVQNTGVLGDRTVSGHPPFEHFAKL